MNSPTLFRRAATAGTSLLLFIALNAAQADAPTAPKPSAPAAPTASAIEAYPLDTCVVAGEKLGDMGKPYDYVYQQDGEPDRLVRFCCKACLPDFKKEPQKYLKRIDEAAAAAAKKKA